MTGQGRGRIEAQMLHPPVADGMHTMSGLLARAGTGAGLQRLTAFQLQLVCLCVWGQGAHVNLSLFFFVARCRPRCILVQYLIEAPVSSRICRISNPSPRLRRVGTAALGRVPKNTNWDWDWGLGWGATFRMANGARLVVLPICRNLVIVPAARPEIDCGCPQRYSRSVPDRCF